MCEGGGCLHFYIIINSISRHTSHVLHTHSLTQFTMSFKKPDKKAKRISKSSLLLGREKKHNISVTSEGHKKRLLELFSLVEQEFDQLHTENTACELISLVHNTTLELT